MQYALLDFIKCPLTKTDLTLQLISEFKKSYEGKEVVEIKEGILLSTTGFVFPIIDGIPRMLIESIYDYSDFLSTHLKEFEVIKNDLQKRYVGLINYCIQKNKKTKKSFEFEWSFFRVDKKDQLWHNDIGKLQALLESEIGEAPGYFANKIGIDVGSGHGLMTCQLAELCKLAIGVELSKAVENAYHRNTIERAHFIQGDLQFLPFADSSFDILYSSGVIHHTNNTELSLSLIETALKPNGKISLWLYHPQDNKIHNFILIFRRFISRLPLELAFPIIATFIFPFTFLGKTLKNKQMPNIREEMIDLLDGLTPEFRFEIPHDLAIYWLKRRNYQDVEVTTTNQFGFSIVGRK